MRVLLDDTDERMNEMVAVTWVDAYLDDEALSHLYVLTTIGFVTERSTEWLSVAAEQLPDGWRAVTHIPIGAVRTVKTLGTL